jgi:hypothetical protein
VLFIEYLLIAMNLGHMSPLKEWGMGSTAKARLVGVSFLLLTILSAGSAYAAPMYYVFTGEVTSADYTPYCSGSNCPPVQQVGALVTFTALVDLAASPSYPYQSAEGQPPFYPHYFYSQYLSGPSWSVDNWSVDKDPTLFNSNFGYGVDLPTGWMVGVYGSLFADATRGADFGDSPFKIYSTDKIVSDWSLGDVVYAAEKLGIWGDVGYRLELTDISSTCPVPEPTAMLLLGAGVVAILLAKRHFTC